MPLQLGQGAFLLILATIQFLKLGMFSVVRP